MRLREESATPQAVCEDVQELLDGRHGPIGLKEFMICLSAFGRTENWQKATQLLVHMRERDVTPDAMVYNKMISICAYARQATEARKLLEDMRIHELAPDNQAVNTVVSALNKDGRAKEASQLLDEMKHWRTDADIFSCNVAISTCASLSTWQQALDLMHTAEAQNALPDVVTYTSTIKACGAAGEWQTAIEVLRRMWDRSVIPNEATCASVVGACARADQPRRAVLLFNGMMMSSVRSNIVVFDEVIGACHRDYNLWPIALHYLTDMPNHRISPDLGTFNQVMYTIHSVVDWGYSQRRHWMMVLGLLRDASTWSLAPDTKSYTAALSACQSAGCWEQVFSLLEEMKSHGIRQDSFTYNIAISACQAESAWSHAVQLLDSMHAETLRPGTVHLSSLITVFEKASAWEKALVTFIGMDRSGLEKNIITYTALAMALTRGGRWDAAVEVIDELRRSGQDLNELAFTAAIIACWSGKNWDRALRYKLEMQRLDIQPYFTTCLYLTAALADAAQWEWIYALFDELHSTYRHTGYENFAIHQLYAVALIACLRHQEPDQALVLLQNMGDYSIDLSPSGYVALLRVLERHVDGDTLAAGLGKIRRPLESWLGETKPTVWKTATPKDVKRHIVPYMEIASRYAYVPAYIEAACERTVYSSSHQRVCSLLAGEKPSEWSTDDELDAFGIFAPAALLGSVAAVVVSTTYSGVGFAKKALRATNSRGHAKSAAWSPHAQLQLRRCRALGRGPLELESEQDVDTSCFQPPESWLAFRVWTARESMAATCSGAVVGAGTLGAQEDPETAVPALQVPDSVEELAMFSAAEECGGHAAALHLTELARSLRLAEWGMEAVHGGVRFYRSRAPCTSCLAAFFQFQRAFPFLHLQVAFEESAEASRWRSSPA